MKALLGPVLLALLVAAPSAQARTLKEAVEQALATHPQVHGAQSGRNAAQEDLKQAKGGYLPSIDLTVGFGQERSDTPALRATGLNGDSLPRQDINATLRQMIFDGAATRSEVDRQGARVESADWRLAATREAVALRAIEVFLEMIKARELTELASANLKSHEETLSKVAQRVKSGIGQRADLQQAQARVALARSILSAREGRLREAESNYQRVVGEQPGPLSAPDAPDAQLARDGAVDQSALKSAIGKAYEAALADNPNVRFTESEVKAAEAAVRGAKSPYLPRISLEVSVTRDQNQAGVPGDVDHEALMLMMRWNLYRGGADQAAERALIERRYATLDQANDAKRETEERVAVALSAKATSEERDRSLRDHVKASQEVLESYRSQLELGRRTLLDVLNAESELFTARSNLAANRYDDLFNHYAVQASQGRLLNSMGVAAGKP